jgi:hypothetical protein
LNRGHILGRHGPARPAHPDTKSAGAFDDLQSMLIEVRFKQHVIMRFGKQQIAGLLAPPLLVLFRSGSAGQAGR